MIVMRSLQKRATALTLTVLGSAVLVAAPARNENVNTKPYPLGNPVIHHMYTADAAPKVMPDGRVWMVTSVDHEDGGGYATMHAVHAFSTADMKHWVDEGELINLADLNEKTGRSGLRTSFIATAHSSSTSQCETFWRMAKRIDTSRWPKATACANDSK